MFYIGTSTCSPNTCFQIEYKNKNCKISKFSVKCLKMLKYREENYDYKYNFILLRMLA
jgi:hypothetical protein